MVASCTSQGAEYQSSKRSHAVTLFMVVSGVTTIIEALVLQNAIISPVLEGYVVGTVLQLGSTALPTCSHVIHF
jgi:hypothetical protein